MGKPVHPAPGIPIEQQPERVILRMLLFGEARGESAIGKLAVLWVVANRAVKHDTSLRDQALKPWQFSSFNGNDPNRAKLLSAFKDEPEAWGECGAIVELYESKATIDPTIGATHYFAQNVVSPPWGPGHPDWQQTVQIGGHTFGNAA